MQRKQEIIVGAMKSETMRQNPISVIRSKPINTLRKKFRHLYPRAWLLEGKERLSKEKLPIIFAGTPNQKNYISHLVYGNFFSERALGRKSILNILRAGRNKSEAAMSVLETDASRLGAIRERKGFCIPTWINARVELNDGFDQVLKAASVKSDLRRIRKNKLQFVVRRDRKSFFDFYHRMYVPYVKSVHGNRAILHSYASLSEKFEQSELMFIKMDNEIVSGQVLIYQNDKVRMREIGIKDGDVRFVKAGAASALYYFGLTYLKDRGFRYVNLGSSRAFLNDGVLQFKKKWGVQLIPHQPNIFILRPLQATAAMKGFLHNNPIIYQRNNELYGAFFLCDHNRMTGDTFKRHQKKYSFRGLIELNYFTLKDGPQGIDIIKKDIQFEKLASKN